MNPLKDQEGKSVNVVMNKKRGEGKGCVKRSEGSGGRCDKRMKR